jgi:hypothetical protein
MMQQELPFFWPLTEQIPLDLDHSNCLKPNIFVNSVGTNGTYLMTAGITSSYITGNLSIDTDQVTFKTSKKPNIVQSMLYKVMGIKLEKK